MTARRPGHASIPWDVAHSVRQRVAALPGGGPRGLGRGGGRGPRGPTDPARPRGHAAEDAVLAALDAACQARLLEEHGQEAYQFTHDVIREVVEQDLGAARRAALHRRVAAALEIARARPPLGRLAFHYVQGDVPDKAACYLERAGDQRACAVCQCGGRGPSTGMPWSSGAAGAALEAARVREKWGVVLRTMGRHDAALAVFERAIAAYRCCRRPGERGPHPGGDLAAL